MGVDSTGASVAAWYEEVGMPAVAQDFARRIAPDGTLGPILSLSPPAEQSYNPAIGVGSSGRAFVAWDTPTAGHNSVKGRWIEPDGTLGPILTILIGSSTDDAGFAKVVVGADGVASVVWYSQISPNHINLRRVNPDGTMGTEVDTLLLGREPAIAALPGGATFVSDEAMTNVVNAGGTPGAPQDAHLTGNASSLRTGLAFDARGDGLLVWRRGSGAPYAVVARRISPAGAPIGSEIVAQPDTTDFVSAEEYAGVDSNAHFLVGWDTKDATNAYHAQVRAINPDGSFAGLARAVGDPGSHQPFVALDDAGTGLAVFDFNPGGAPAPAAGQLLGAGAQPLGTPVPLSSDASGQMALANDPPSGVATDLYLQASGSTQNVLMARRFLEPPACADTTATVVQGQPIEVPASCTGVAVNAFAVAGQPAHGSVSAGATSFHYTPQPGYQGSDSFVYNASNDGGTSANATAHITVGRDTVAPRITAFALKRKRVRRRPLKFKYSFVLRYSEPATGKVTLQRRVRKSRRCHGRRCTKFKTVATLSSKTLGSSVTIPVSVRLVRRLSHYGKLRVSAAATDAAGNKSPARRLNAHFR